MSWYTWSEISVQNRGHINTFLTDILFCASDFIMALGFNHNNLYLVKSDQADFTVISLGIGTKWRFTEEWTRSREGKGTGK